MIYVLYGMNIRSSYILAGDCFESTNKLNYRINNIANNFPQL